MQLILLFVGCTLLSFLGTRIACTMLEKLQVMDHPNERSNHAMPKLRGAGVAIIDTLLIGFIILGVAGVVDIYTLWPLLLAAFVLAGVSFFDDIRHVPVRIRLGAQLLAVIIGLSTLGQGALVFQGWFPLWFDRVLAGCLWIWFINLYNFMDGIDGITGSETLCIGGGLAAITLLTGVIPVEFAFYGVILAATVLGFLPYNWHPSKVFMGDVGSISLGFFIGWVLLKLSASGYGVVALILPLYYLMDSGITLCRRLLRGEKIWQAHSTHFYQRAVRGGKRHDQVVKAMILANILLMVIAWWAVTHPGFFIGAILGAAIVVAGLLRYYTLRQEHV